MRALLVLLAALSVVPDVECQTAVGGEKKAAAAGTKRQNAKPPANLPPEKAVPNKTKEQPASQAQQQAGDERYRLAPGDWINGAIAVATIATFILTAVFMRESMQASR